VQVIAEADRDIVAVQRGASESRLVNLQQGQTAFMADLEARVNREHALLGIDTGFTTVNELTFGWQKGDMVVIAARPSIGKTAFVLNTAMAAAKTSVKVALFSLEMRRTQLEYRLLSTLSGVQLSRILSGNLSHDDFEQLSVAMTTMASLGIYVDDRAGQSAWDIRSACRRLRAEEGLGLVVVDYVQLMPGTLDRRGANRNDELTDISRRLKTLADEVQCPVIVLSQLKRLDGRRPTIEDLRECGALEQDADLVCLMHRKNHRESGVTSFAVEKQRNGPTGTVNLVLTRETQTFVDHGIEPEEQALPGDGPQQVGSGPRPPRGWRRR
jgi:replicative DNA helicase